MEENYISTGKYKLTLTRKKNFVGCAIAFKVFIDGEMVGVIKNGKTLELQVTPGDHEISIHKNNPVHIIINGDTTADVVVFGANNFGITNINGQGQIVENNQYANKNTKSNDIFFYISILIPIISIILLYSVGYVISVWVYGFVIGYCIVNFVGLKNLKSADTEKYKSSLIKNVVSVVINIIAIVLTLCVTI